MKNKIHLVLDTAKEISKKDLLNFKGGVIDPDKIACCVYLYGQFMYSGNSTTGSCDGIQICDECTVEPCDESEG